MHSKALFAMILLSHAEKAPGSLGNRAWGSWGARVRERTRTQKAKGHKAWNLPRTLKRAVNKVQRQESCPGPGGPHRPNLTVVQGGVSPQL